MSTHKKGTPIQGDFCVDNLRFVMACSDRAIEAALAHIPAYDLARLRRLLNTPLKGMEAAPPEHRKAS